MYLGGGGKDMTGEVEVIGELGIVNREKLYGL